VGLGHAQGVVKDARSDGGLPLAPTPLPFPSPLPLSLARSSLGRTFASGIGVSLREWDGLERRADAGEGPHMCGNPVPSTPLSPNTVIGSPGNGCQLDSNMAACQPPWHAGSQGQGIARPHDLNKHPLLLLLGTQ
jgi:hypothetical protein